MNEEAIRPVSTNTAEHYTWGNGCDGWHLVKSDALSIIQERMPSGTSEVKHYHKKARQFFFILAGTATMEVGDKTLRLSPFEGIEIPPLIAHQMRNDSQDELIFTVTSTPKSHGDRIHGDRIHGDRVHGDQITLS
ncbi:cupin domain-containing protein [Spirosoma daeguense]